MSALDKARAAARENLLAITGDARPTWRQVFTDAESLSGVAPVCTDEEHNPDDTGDLYGCCPDPAIETFSEPVAAYLVALLNADREGGAE